VASHDAGGGRRARTGYTPGALLRPSINGNTTGGGHLSYDAAHHRTGYCEQAGVEVDIHQLRHAHATELINNGVSIDADAVLGLTARIQPFGGYATDEAALAPEPFDADHHWSGSSRSIWSTSLSALGALDEVKRGRRETVVLSDR
jgi:hypothetical protein